MVGIRNSECGALELMWNPEATRKFRVTLVCAARCTFVSGTGAMETDGPLPDCAAAEAASKPSTHIAFRLGLGEFIGVVPRSYPK